MLKNLFSFQNPLYISMLLLVSSSFMVSCDESEDTKVETSFTITIAVFTLEGESYISTGNDIILVTQDACQTWSRSALVDNHNESSHLHFNAASNVSYNEDTEIVTWTEFGPELDQSSIDATCSDGKNGINKSANKTSYFEDKGVYLKIIAVTS